MTLSSYIQSKRKLAEAATKGQETLDAHRSSLDVNQCIAISRTLIDYKRDAAATVPKLLEALEIAIEQINRMAPLQGGQVHPRSSAAQALADIERILGVRP